MLSLRNRKARCVTEKTGHISKKKKGIEEKINHFRDRTLGGPHTGSLQRGWRDGEK